MTGTGPGGALRRFRIVALASLLWNAFGSLDYILTQLRVAAYIGSFPPAVMPWIDAFPYWATAAWGLGVALSLAGSILLLLRSRRALQAFVASLGFATIGMGYRHFSGYMPPSLDTVGRWVFDLLLLGAIVLQAWYTRRQLMR